MDIKEYMHTVGRQARAASRRMAMASTAEKNAALAAIAAAIRREKAALVAANAEDLAAARAAGLESAMIDRLTLSEKGVEAMAQGLDPVVGEGETAPKAPKQFDDSARLDAIRAAMQQIAERNKHER